MIACDACGKKFRANEKLHGKTVRCPNCGEPIHIPAAQAPDIGDLLDDELQVAPAEEEAASPAAASRGPKCRQCGDELPPDTRYCVVCGCNNFDVGGAVSQIALEDDKRQQDRDHEDHWLWMALRVFLFWR